MAIKLIIKSYYPSLTKSERKVADYVLKMDSEIINSTIADVANDTGVGEATVLRFCNKIGCDKFANLKLLIAKETENGAYKKSGDVIKDLEFEMVDVIKNTANILDLKCVKKTVDYIDKAQHVYFYGVGASGLTALEAEGNFLRIGKMAMAITDGHFQIMNASVLQKEDLVIAFSLTGNTKDIYESLSVAKEAGAKIVVVTNYIESSISKLADVVLLTAAKEHLLKGGTLTGTVSQLFVVDALKQEYSSRHMEKVKKLREKTAKSIINKAL